ncbi:50S ribosomal protein L25 [Candidatus Kaiserbacteria bacterium]|nr:MAG: 50S ribosomal protein L25 [Candidatus Kaiserbacteria bacterium]
MSNVAFEPLFGIVLPYMTELNVKTRDKSENIVALRKEGQVPAVFYGPKEENTPVTINAREFIRVWGEAGGATIVDLKGVGEDKEVLIHEVSWHPVTGDPVHVDFYCIERGKKLTVSVPLEFVGEAPAEKLGGIVTKVAHELEVEVRPRDIPQSIEVDVTLLEELSSAITVADLKLPEGVKPTVEMTETIASITVAKEEVEEEVRDIADIEIESKGKDVEEGEEKEGE